jgi:hypothetical protein
MARSVAIVQLDPRSIVIRLVIPGSLVRFETVCARSGAVKGRLVDLEEDRAPPGDISRVTVCGLELLERGDLRCEFPVLRVEPCLV